MSVHHISILNPPDCPTFDLIKSGQKTVEGRKNSPKYQSIKEGDIIVFHYFDKENRKKHKLRTRVTYVHRYTTVERYLRGETLRKALPCVRTYAEGIEVYNKWTTAQERKALRKKYGFAFLGIGIELEN